MRTRRPITKEIIAGTVTDDGVLVWHRKSLLRPGRVQVTIWYDEEKGDAPGVPDVKPQD